jgi:hypothetical protein
MDSTIKTLTITGSAASMNPETPKSRRGVSRRKTPKNTDAESYDMPQDAEPSNEYEKPDSDIPPIKKAIITKVNLQAVRPVLPARPMLPVQPPARPVQEQQQPQEKVPVVSSPIEKPKEITSVTLNPPKQPRVKLMPKVSGVKTQPVQNQTRKVRKIQLPNLTNRITRAKRVSDETKKVPIDKIKSYLINKGVIQAKSKAPDSMLRSMYGDFNILKDGHAL